MRYLGELLEEAGLTPRVFARDPSRPNLVVRLPGRGEREPLLLHGHVDVVTTTRQRWTHPPFSSAVADGYLWGRGALDMKAAVAGMVWTLLDLRAHGHVPGGDLVLAILSDEEAGGDYGAGFLVERHPEQFAGIRYALTEGGGQSVTVLGRQVHPIAVAEKRVCWMRGTARGQGGHGSLPIGDAAVERVARAVAKLAPLRLPARISEAARLMFTALAPVVGEQHAHTVERLLDPRTVDSALDRMDPALARTWGALVRDTVAPTTLQAGGPVNLIPSEASFQLDCRLLPGRAAQDLRADIQALVGPAIELEVERTQPPSPERPDMTHFETLAEVTREVVGPEAVAIPALLFGFTDGCHFAKLGIQSYGFLPCRLDFDWVSTIHAADERTTLEAVDQCALGLREAALRILS